MHNKQSNKLFSFITSSKREKAVIFSHSGSVCHSHLLLPPQLWPLTNVNKVIMWLPVTLQQPHKQQQLRKPRLTLSQTHTHSPISLSILFVLGQCQWTFTLHRKDCLSKETNSAISFLHTLSSSCRSLFTWLLYMYHYAESNKQPAADVQPSQTSLQQVEKWLHSCKVSGPRCYQVDIRGGRRNWEAALFLCMMSQICEISTLSTSVCTFMIAARFQTGC